MNPRRDPAGLTPELAADLYRGGLTLAAIAARYGTNPKQVSRMLDRVGCARRPRGTPTAPDRRNVPVPQERRERIGRSQAVRWGQRPRPAGIAPRIPRGDFGRGGVARLREASRSGSRLAAAVADAVEAAGHPVSRPGFVRVGGRRVRVACLVERPGCSPVAVVVRGPSHFRPVFGPDKLVSQQQADAAAEDRLAAAGYSVVSVEADRRSVSGTYLADLCGAAAAAVPRAKRPVHRVARA